MTRGHDITIEQTGPHVRVVRDGQVLAESRRAVTLRETGCPVRYYLPPEDVRMDLLTPSDTRTHCPFKGDARYWSVPGGADIAWAYPDPKPAVTAIAHHLCFYDTELL
ncbi:DUF427 domain-containing protein [Streptomyces sp. NPDC051567]|uniref:DUF427 domain-containing protein n=1 Tax=Streptomyces sp. NPDC051567 TaxID=3365660 RepID=UPI00378FC6AB